MTYTQTIERLFQFSPSSSAKHDLRNAHILNRALNDPISAYPTIHVAGSNGKGSVTTKIAKVLELSGYRVGLYTSPHLFSFRERIAINGQLISEEAVVEGMQQLFSLQAQRKLNVTFFELTTFLAFEYFRKEAVDVAIVETGLGGKWDATNVVQPELTVITSISREHTEILGKNVEQIAAEKAGILKEKTPVVLGPKARAQSIYDRAQQLHCPIFASKKISYFYDEENSAIAELAIDQLTTQFKVDPLALQDGLKVRPPCRFERIGDAILDVAHNPEAIFYLLQALHTFFPERKLRFLVGFSKEKEYSLCLDLIANVATHIHLVQARSPRAASTKELQEALKSEDLTLSTPHPSIEEGVKEAYHQAKENSEILVVCGSFYIMAEAKEVLGIQSPKDVLESNEKTFLSIFSSSLI